MSLRAMFGSHPHANAVTYSEPLAQCVVQCHACAEACTVCADACLAEPDVEGLRQCIRRNLDCADICAAMAAVASRRTGDNLSVLRSMLETCSLACHLCAEECGRHGEMHEHCRICADACKACDDACRRAMSTVH